MAANDNNYPDYQQALDHEGAMIAAGKEKFRQKMQDSDLSARSYVHKWAMPRANKTADILQEMVDKALKQQGGPPEAVKRIKDLDLFAVAYTAFMCAVDGSDKQWTLTELRFNIGRAVACMAYETALMETRQGRRLAERLTRSADLVADQFEARADFVAKIVKERGFDWDDWRKDDDSLCSVVGSFVVIAVQRGNRDIFIPDLSYPNPDDDYASYYMVLTDEALEELDGHLEELAAVSPTLAPMVTKPRPWDKHHIGPYNTPMLAQMVPFVKRASPWQRQYIYEGMRNGRLDKACKALNHIQDTPYQINEYVVDAVDWVRKRGLTTKVGSFPHMRTVKVPKLAKEEVAQLSLADKRIYWRERKQAKAHNRQAKSNRTKLKRTLKLARDYLTWPEFYLPHNFDRRGRIYHVSDFGHHNTDHMRAMFLLKNKTKVTPENEYWLKRQLANSWGNKVDKETFARREAWVDQNEADILKAGEDFKGPKDAHFAFWSKADDPFQFLAACREWFRYKTARHGYSSGLPIAIDATQSGIQHYAAASLNHHDGDLVNLVRDPDPNATPRDLYEACLEVAKQLLEDDLEDKLAQQAANPVNDNERQEIEQYEADISDEDLDADTRKRMKRQFDRSAVGQKAKRDQKIRSAQQWKNFGLLRKHIKRNTMTWAYSSREFGFAKQLQSDIMDPLSTEVRLNERDEHPFQPDNGHAAAFYLADLNEKAIESKVESAAAGMAFFQSLATIMASDVDEDGNGKHIEFLTPHIGFPMAQYYRPEYQKLRRAYIYKHEYDEVDNRGKISVTRYRDGVKRAKSQSASSPNIIHAMDSTHLMMTALKCAEKGVNDLMVVHDSFATTIAHAAEMEAAVKEAFVELYTDYCLYTDIMEQCKRRHSKPDSVEWPTVPSKGDKNGRLLNLEGILDALYPFS